MTAEHWGTDRRTWADTQEESDLWSASKWFRQPGDFASVNAAFESREEDPPPTFGVRSDGQALFYSGEVNSIFGDHSSAKSWLALYTVKQAVEAGEKVLYFDFEDSARKAGYRLRIIGTSARCIEENLMHVRPSGAFSSGERDMLRSLIHAHTFGLVVIDTVGVALGVDGLDANKDGEVARWLDVFPNAVAALGPCVLMVDHGAVSANDPNKPGGSGRKMQSVNGAAYHVKRLEPYGIGRTGKSLLTCKKDRNGVYSINEDVALFQLASADKWQATATLEPYTVSTDKVADGVRLLDVQRAPLDITRDDAAALLRGAGWKGNNSLIAEILKARTDHDHD
jgi:hypothetical protein